MNKLLSVRFAGQVGSAISVLGVMTAHASVVPPNLAVAEMPLPPEATFLLVGPVLLVTFAFIVWMFLLLLKKPEREHEMTGATPRLYPHLSRPSTHQDVWFDGAIDRSRTRRAYLTARP